MPGHDIRGYQTLWNQAAPLSAVSVSSPTWVGIYATFNQPGTVYGISAFLYATGGLRHLGWIAQDGQTQFVQGCSFDGWHENPTTNRWSSAFIKRPIQVSIGQTFVIAVLFNFTNYGLMVAAHSGDTDTTIGNFTIPADTSGRPNGATQTSPGLSLPFSIGAAKPAIDFLYRQA